MIPNDSLALLMKQVPAELAKAQVGLNATFAFLAIGIAALLVAIFVLKGKDKYEDLPSFPRFIVGVVGGFVTLIAGMMAIELQTKIIQLQNNPTAWAIQQFAKIFN